MRRGEECALRMVKNQPAADGEEQLPLWRRMHLRCVVQELTEALQVVDEGLELLRVGDTGREHGAVPGFAFNADGALEPVGDDAFQRGALGRGG